VTTVNPKPGRQKPMTGLNAQGLRQILSDVALLTLVASGRVSVDTVELTDAFSRVLLWRARVVGGLTTQLLDVEEDSDAKNSP